MSASRRWATRRLAWTSSIVGLTTVALFVAMLKWGSTSGGTQALIAGFGLVAAATTVVANILMVQLAPKEVGQLSAAPLAQLGGSTFVDRDVELTLLARRLADARVVACHGPQGTGKSYLLQYVVDVVNGHRPLRPGHDADPQLPSAALYFDLADTVGWEKVERQLCDSVLGSAMVSSWPGFCQEIDRQYGETSVLLVLDNVNAPALWPSIGRAVYGYLQVRQQDRVVLGSIEPVVLDNMTLASLEVPAFDSKAIEEFAAAQGCTLDSESADELREATLGLPLFLGLALSRPEERGLRQFAASAALERSLRLELPAPGRRAISYIALLALVERRISARELARLPIADLEEQLDRAAHRSLVAIRSENGYRSIRVHDIVRDSALEVLEDEVRDAASVLVDWATHHDDDVQACIFALYSDPSSLDEKRLWSLVDSVLRAAVKARDYALLETIHHRISTSERLTTFTWADRARSDLLSYGRGSQLAGLGRYRDAEDELLESSVVSVRPGTLDSLSGLQVDLYYLLADVIHLQNRYDEAAGMFRDLVSLAVSRDDSLLESRCLRAVGHVLRHQGRDFESALFAFENAERAGERAGDLRARMLATTGRIGVRVYTGTVTAVDAEALVAIDGALIASDGLGGYRFNVWKYQAQVAWALGERSKAIDLAEASIAEALRLNDRLLYNLYFDRAEYARLAGRLDAAVPDYDAVLDFGLANGDRNLIANARLGLVACDLASPGWPAFLSAKAALAEVLRARDTAAGADIQATVQEATALANAVASGDPSYSPRFILF